MKRFGWKAILTVLFCTMLYTASAFADSATDHVSVAPNGKGDVLIFPTYFAADGLETKLVVTNTSLTRSVVAKVVVRSKEISQELLDFFIYLSPSDVWTGTLMNGTYTESYQDASGNQDTGTGVYMMSTDGSCEARDGAWASTADPFVAPLVGVCTGDTNTIGYVTVIENASFDLGGPGVTKATIKTAVDAWNAADVLPPVNSMTGLCEVVNPGDGFAMGLNATALKNYDYNEAVQMTTTNETLLGENANNFIGEVAAALSKDEVVVPYYSNDMGSFLAMFNFPTKYSSMGNCAVKSTWTGQFAGFPSPVYVATAYDLDENTETVTTDPGKIVSPQPDPTVADPSTFPGEVNFLSDIADPMLEIAFDEGWLLIDGTNYTTTFETPDGNTTYTYTGFPMIATSIRINAEDGYGNTGWFYNAHTLGTVDLGANTTEEDNYHYWGQTDSQ